MAISLLNYTHCQCSKTLGRVNHDFIFGHYGNQPDGRGEQKKTKMKNSLWKTESSVVLVRWDKNACFFFFTSIFIRSVVCGCSFFLLLSISHMELHIFMIIMNCFCFRRLAICTFAHKCIFIGLSIAITNHHVHDHECWIFTSLWDQLEGDRMLYFALSPTGKAINNLVERFASHSSYLLHFRHKAPIYFYAQHHLPTEQKYSA